VEFKPNREFPDRLGFMVDRVRSRLTSAAFGVRLVIIGARAALRLASCAGKRYSLITVIVRLP